MHARFIAFLSLSLYFLGLVSASPELVPRQASVTIPASLASPTSVTTTSTFETANGTMTETCVITFTPVGQQIQQISNCTVAAGEGSQVTSTLVPAASSAAAEAFVMPGTTIQVFPIGLGIYGGITSIALFAVALVTWERVHYRKAFRKQKMAESSLKFVYNIAT